MCQFRIVEWLNSVHTVRGPRGYARLNWALEMPRFLKTALTVPGLRSLPRQFGIDVVRRVLSLTQIS